MNIIEIFWVIKKIIINIIWFRRKKAFLITLGAIIAEVALRLVIHNLKAQILWKIGYRLNKILKLA